MTTAVPSPRLARGLFFSSVIPALCAALSMAAYPARAAQIHLHTDQQMIEEVMNDTDLDTDNPVAVFEAVFQQLPAKVTVYPTESYYYFTFPHKGIIWAGNIRFDAWDQFDGKVHFAYNPEYAYWRKPQEPTYRKLGTDEGLKVTQVSKFVYTIEYKGKTVEFDIPDLSNVKPAPGQLRADEVYIGPSWDESGVQFFVIYNKTAKTFLYLLNDNPKMDIYEPSEISPSLTIGNRSSFAVYKDKLADRQILIGVFSGNTQLNNYFDGPFDQLPDNYVQGNALHDAILDIVPEVKEKIDRYGSLESGAERYAITPYKYYDTPKMLEPIVDCATREDDPAKYYSCFNVAQDDLEGDENGQPKPEGEDAQNTPAPTPAPQAQNKPDGAAPKK